MWLDKVWDCMFCIHLCLKYLYREAEKNETRQDHGTGVARDCGVEYRHSQKDEMIL